MDEKLGIEKNVRMAAEHHVVRFGSVATVCNANPDDLKEAIVVDGLRVIPEKSCQLGHLFVGRKL